MGKLNKKQISLIIVYAILFVVFNVVYFAAPFTKTAGTWVMYVFSLISIVVGLIITMYAFWNTDDSDDLMSREQGLQSKVYGFPIFRIGIIYVVLQLCISVVIFAIGHFINVPAWVGIIISVILLGVALIGVIATDNVRDMVQETERVTYEKTKKMKSFKLDFDGIVTYAKDPELKNKLEKLAEKVKYSDPVSSDELEEIEAELQSETDALRSLVKSGEVAEASEKADFVTNLLEDRNRRCKAGKGR
ncbi:MAG: hypothetical protein K6D02_01695 [Lachnospiraceae bacterium]|nr:hypothetical protein [Lachnospiraceae bacterium]